MVEQLVELRRRTAEPAASDGWVARGARARGAAGDLPPRRMTIARTELVEVMAGGAALDGDLTMPPGARAAVAFAHGSGSGRASPRNRAVAAAFQAEGLGTLLVDLLTAEESARDAVTAELRFDIDLLTGRLAGAVDWLARTYGPDLAIGLYGASTGASAALRCAAERPVEVRAVVSRGGRADLAGEALERVGAPALLIVGEADPIVLELNRVARERLLAESELVVVPGAGHLFEEPGALERVAELSAGWFRRHLA